MSFTENDKLKALAIVHVFETSKPFGDYAACVVLNDGAGVSYGINQFTHRSGSLLEVVEKYLADGGAVGRAGIEEALPTLKQKSAGAIGKLSASTKFKKALKAAAVTSEMRAAQRYVAEKRYLRPAIEAAEGSGFVLPLSLAVIYDSINHGSYAKIRDRVNVSRKSFATNLEFEKAWIYSYVKNRDAWLESVPRLAVTDYRTDFFLAQIARGNWMLELPVNVHGVKLEKVSGAVSPMSQVPSPKSESVSSPSVSAGAQSSPPYEGGVAAASADGVVLSDQRPKIQDQSPSQVSAVGPLDTPAVILANPQNSQPIPPEPSFQAHTTGAQPLNNPEDAERLTWGRAGAMYEQAAARFDEVSGVLEGVGRRKDAAKSMWTTIGSTIWQSVWAVIAFFIGLPREVWLTVAIIAGAFMLYYLYRQIALGKMREAHRVQGSTFKVQC